MMQQYNDAPGANVLSVNDVENDGLGSYEVNEKSVEGVNVLNVNEMIDCVSLKASRGPLKYAEISYPDDVESDGLGNEINAEDFEVIEDVELHPCDSADEEDGICDFDNKEPTTEVQHNGIIAREFKYQPDGSIKLMLGHTFITLEFFRQVLVDYCIQEGVSINKEKNESYRVTAKCKDPKCKWRVHVSHARELDRFVVKTFNPTHECERKTWCDDATAVWIARAYGSLIRSNPNIEARVLQEMILTKHGLEVPKGRIYRGKRLALKCVGGDHKTAYAEIYKYANAVRKYNEQSITFVLSSIPSGSKGPTFESFFLSFGAQIEGFIAGCRPYIGLDGCHLRGAYGGVLLTVVALDSNSMIFPLAVAIVDSENFNSWSWFLRILYESVGSKDNRKITFMTDRQKGLIPALEQTWSNANTRYCARHIYANFKQQWSGIGLKRLFWKASKIATEKHFKLTMEEIKQVKNVGEAAYAWLSKIHPRH
ncbi:Mutator-like transposase [Melia azedarach]|uniref:Mutator-like transposase n=1 Tax=Melia azedarach TaxID=155640 RepID=A0ACC1YPX3_MELAZ|nr:Mutator-like transposase [Melia azedarach]